MSPDQKVALIDSARYARERAVAPYSHFKVGAALADADGRVYTGCNIECSSYSLTLCAERVALFKALSEGAAKIVAVAVVVDTLILTPPCGACRQVLWDFCSGAELILANLAGESESLLLRDVFPRAFDRSFL